MLRKCSFSKLFLFSWLSFGLFSGSAWAAGGLSLSIPSIPGEGANNSIDVFSFSFGVASTATPLSPGRPNFSDLTIMKALDSTSSLLMFDCASGTTLNNVVLTYRDNSNNPAYTITLCNVNISSVQLSGAAGGGAPTESVSLHFQQIQWSYQKFDSGGQPVGSPITHGWDMAANTPLNGGCP